MDREVSDPVPQTCHRDETCVDCGGVVLDVACAAADELR
jgi:hypothetical protein